MRCHQPRTEPIGRRDRIDSFLWLFLSTFTFNYEFNPLGVQAEIAQSAGLGRSDHHWGQGFSMSIWEISERKRIPVGILRETG